MSERPTASMRERVDQALAQERTEQAITSRPPDADDDPAAMRAELAACRTEILRLRKGVHDLDALLTEERAAHMQFLAQLMGAIGTPNSDTSFIEDTP